MNKGLTVRWKMGADSLAKNTLNAPEFICPIYLPKPKFSGFQFFIGRSQSVTKAQKKQTKQP